MAEKTNEAPLVFNDDDTRLMLAFRGGDENSFLQLLARYEERIVNYAFRYTGNRDEAEDIAQEVFLRVYNAATTYQPKAKFSTWIYTIATNLCLDRKRKTGRDTLASAEPLFGRTQDGDREEKETPDTAEKPLEASAERRQDDALIEAALLALPDNQRLALTLKIYEGKPYAEIAQILDCSIPAVESLIFRARQTLKQKLASLA